MKRVLLLVFWVLVPGICQALPSKEVAERINAMNDAAVVYRDCLLKVFDSKVIIIADLRAMADAIIRECEPERTVFRSAHFRLTGGPQDISEEVVTTIENQIIGEHKAKHDIRIAKALMRVVTFRGLYDFCPSANKDVITEETSRILLGIIKADAAYRDADFFEKQLAKYHAQYVKESITKSGIETWCRDRKTEAEEAGIAKDYFK